MAQSTSKGGLFWRIVLESGKHAPSFWVRIFLYPIICSTSVINWYLTVLTYNAGSGGCERLAFYGISSNLVTYLTSKLHEGNVSAARNVTTWQGTCYFIPLLGGVLADAYWGRYWTMTVFFTIYLLVSICWSYHLFLSPARRITSLKCPQSLNIRKATALCQRFPFHIVSQL